MGVEGERRMIMIMRWLVPPHALDKVFDNLSDFSARFDVVSFTLFSHGGEGPWRPRRDFPLGG